VVGGDRLTIAASVDPGGHALATTPGAGKFYRSAGRPATVRQQLTVAAGGVLEWFPQEALVFDGARCHLQTRVDLAEGGRFMGWDILCLGRPASRDFFREGLVDNRLRISRAGRPLLIERLRIENETDLLRSSGQRGFIVSASFVATGCQAEVLNMVRDSPPPTPEGLWGATLLDDLLVVRYLGNAVEEARALFTGIWRRIRPVLYGRDACLPRIWAT
jgi:urease accessory protein